MHYLLQMAIDFPYFSVEILRIFFKPIMIITFLGHHHFKGTLSFYFKVLNISVILLLFLVVD